MKKACLFVAKIYQNNEIFNKENQAINPDNLLIFFQLLKNLMSQHGFDLSTQDLYDPADCDIVIYNEMPKDMPKLEHVGKSYLLLIESALIRPDNWDLRNHQHFSKIFTWHDQFIDNKKYFKICFVRSGETSFVPFKDKKFCTLIAGNKRLTHELELYSERRKTIQWFEQNRPGDFEFYGTNWDRYIFRGPLLIRALNKVPGLGKFVAKKWPSYRGKITRKLDVLRNYKFSICYENVRDLPGYVTEKIFDSLAAGCIPVYWGASNITDYVDDQCFIDRKKFSSHEALYDYLVRMTEAEYNDRIEAINQYFLGDKYANFIPAVVTQKVVENIVSA